MTETGTVKGPSVLKKKTPFPERMRTEPIDIFEAWCKHCELCLTFCPAGVFSLSETGKVFVEHPETCNQCGICANICPDMAILLLPKKRREE